MSNFSCSDALFAEWKSRLTHLCDKNVNDIKNENLIKYKLLNEINEKISVIEEKEILVDKYEFISDSFNYIKSDMRQMREIQNYLKKFYDINLDKIHSNNNNCNENELKNDPNLNIQKMKIVDITSSTPEFIDQYPSAKTLINKMSNLTKQMDKAFKNKKESREHLIYLQNKIDSIKEKAMAKNAELTLLRPAAENVMIEEENEIIKNKLQIDNLTSKLNELKFENTNLKNENSELENKIRNATPCGTDETSVNHFEMKMKKLIEDENNNIQKLIEPVKEAKLKVNESQSKMSSLNQQMTNQFGTSDLRFCKWQLQKNIKEIETANKLFQDKQHAYEAKQKELEKLEKQLESINMNIGAHSVAIDKLKTRITTKKTEMNKLNKMKEEYNGHQAEATQQLNEKKSKIKKNKQKINQIAEEIDLPKLRKHFQLTENEIKKTLPKNFQKCIETSKNKFQSLIDKLSETEKRIELITSEKSSLAEEKNKLQNELYKTDEKLKESKNTLKSTLIAWDSTIRHKLLNEVVESAHRAQSVLSDGVKSHFDKLTAEYSKENYEKNNKKRSAQQMMNTSREHFNEKKSALIKVNNNFNNKYINRIHAIGTEADQTSGQLNFYRHTEGLIPSDDDYFNDDNVNDEMKMKEKVISNNDEMKISLLQDNRIVELDQQTIFSSNQRLLQPSDSIKAKTSDITIRNKHVNTSMEGKVEDIELSQPSQTERRVTRTSTATTKRHTSCNKDEIETKTEKFQPSQSFQMSTVRYLSQKRSSLMSLPLSQSKPAKKPKTSNNNNNTTHNTTATTTTKTSTTTTTTANTDQQNTYKSRHITAAQQAKSKRTPQTTENQSIESRITRQSSRRIAATENTTSSTTSRAEKMRTVDRTMREGDTPAVGAGRRSTTQHRCSVPPAERSERVKAIDTSFDRERGTSTVRLNAVRSTATAHSTDRQTDRRSGTSVARTSVRSIEESNDRPITAAQFTSGQTTHSVDRLTTTASISARDASRTRFARNLLATLQKK